MKEKEKMVHSVILTVERQILEGRQIIDWDGSLITIQYSFLTVTLFKGHNYLPLSATSCRMLDDNNSQI